MRSLLLRRISPRGYQVQMHSLNSERSISFERAENSIQKVKRTSESLDLGRTDGWTSAADGCLGRGIPIGVPREIQQRRIAARISGLCLSLERASMEEMWYTFCPTGAAHSIVLASTRSAHICTQWWMTTSMTTMRTTLMILCGCRH